MRMGKGLYLALLVMSLLITACGQKIDKVPTSEGYFVKVGTDTIFPGQPRTSTLPRRSLTPHEQGLLDSMVTALRMVAERSPTATELLVFYQHSGRPAWYFDQDHVVPVDPMTDVSIFYVVPIPVDAMPGIGMSGTAARFNPLLTSVELFQTTFQPMIKGIVFAHELQHARDHMYVDNEIALSYSPKWLEREGRAHRTVFTILDEYTHGGWSKVVEKSVADRYASMPPLNGQLPPFTFGALASDSVYIVKLFGQISHEDLSLLDTQLTVDTNLHIIDRATAGNPMLTRRSQQAFLTSFYRRLHVPRPPGT